MVNYRDTLEPQVTHCVEFCTRLFDFAGILGEGSTEEDCEHHNCADEECRAP